MKLSPAMFPITFQAARVGSVVAWMAEDKLVYGLKLADGGPKGINVLMLSDTARRVPGDLRTMDTNRQVLSVPDAVIEPDFGRFKMKGGENSVRGELEVREAGRVLMKTRSEHEDVEDYLVDLDTGEMVSYRTLPYDDKVFPLIVEAWSLVLPDRIDRTKRQTLVAFPIRPPEAPSGNRTATAMDRPGSVRR